MHIMIDIETLGTRPTPVVLSIGAVAFDPDTAAEKQDMPTFYANVDTNSAKDLGLLIDGETVRWWMRQSESARQAVMDDEQELSTVLVSLHRFVQEHAGRNGVRVWSHGATFDIPIIAELYALLDMRPPWHYSDARDTRTLFDLAGYKLDSVSERATGHNALEDAKIQAAGVCAAYTIIFP